MQRRSRFPGRSVTRVMAITALIAASLLAGCASAPPDTATLDQARAHYGTAAGKDGIFEIAASSMRQAEQHLAEAERLAAESGSQTEIDHHGFLARQHVAIAEARLRRALAQRDLDRAEDRRRALLLTAEQRQATAAAERAQAMEDELAETRMQLRLAEERAKTLADRLVEAGVTSSRESDD